MRVFGYGHINHKLLDITLELTRFAVTAIILLFLLRTGNREGLRNQKGWIFILSGMSLILFGMGIDITDNFPALNKYVIIGDTRYQAFLEKAVGSLMGFILLAVGLWKWIPAVVMLKNSQSVLLESQSTLELQIEQRTADLYTELVERERAQKKLRKKDHFLENVLNSIQDGIIVMDMDYNVIQTNPAIEKLIQMDNSSINQKCYVACKDLTEPCHDCPSVRTIKSGLADEETMQHTNKNGETHWLNMRSFPLCDPETGEMEGIIKHVRDITQSVEADKLIKNSLREKEFLLAEIHHRVKNNMAIIIALLNLQLSKISDPRLIESFNDCQSRIMSMALVHEKLYHSESFGKIDIEDYMRSLYSSIMNSYHTTPMDISLSISAPDIHLNLDSLVPFGIILNELISNSIAHAFGHTQAPAISIALRNEGEGHILTYYDNGGGLPLDIDIKQSMSLGIRLIRNLVAQLDGNIHLSRDSGTLYKISF